MNINTQMRYGAYSEYSFRTTKTGKGDTGFEESMKPDNNIQYKSLGIGFLNVGDTGYGMRATQIINPDSEDTIVRVSIALGGNEFRDYDVNLSEIDPSNASAVEMFAYCQYADSTSEGSYKWGSWNALKHLTDDMAYSYNSLDEALTEKKNWNAALAGSGIELENEATGERYFVSDIIEMLKQQYELTADDLEEKEQDKIQYGLLLLKTQERLSAKFVKFIRDGVFELRTEYNSNIYRVFFIFDDGNIVVLFNGFQKKTTKTPDIEIERALKIKEEYYADKQSSASRL